jgi:hypothetical protein
MKSLQYARSRFSTVSGGERYVTHLYPVEALFSRRFVQIEAWYIASWQVSRKKEHILRLAVDQHHLTRHCVLVA